MKNNLNKLLSPQQVADMLGIRTESVRAACNRGTLKATLVSDLLPGKIQGWLITPEAMEEYRARTQPDGVKKAGRPRVRPLKEAVNDDAGRA